MDTKCQSAEVLVRGVVQGVGFRPFIYRLARELDLTGWVCNSSDGVRIEVEGDNIDRFLEDMQAKSPPVAFIEEIEAVPRFAKGYIDFTIGRSFSRAGEHQLVSPDVATCPDCLAELFDAADRRFDYPFINCTNCGPRFTIIEDLPYDRPQTTMRVFEMCPECQREYDDPENRRFHAQPNACPVCGPHLTLTDAKGSSLPGDDEIEQTAQLLKHGKIVAIKGLGGYLLACDATNPHTVRRLRERKKRPDKPLAVMFADMHELRRNCVTTPEERKLLESVQCPIVLVPRKKETQLIVREVAPVGNYLGVMLPYTPLHHLLMRKAGVPLVMTSGNLSEEPIAGDNAEAFRRMSGIADYFLMHDRDIRSRYDDSVFCVEAEKTRVIRRARGYAPYPVFLPFETLPTLACGSELKNTFCLSRGNHAFLSQHIGDLENRETLDHYEATIDLYQRLFGIEPEIIAYDMHPDYLPTKYALELAGENPRLKTVAVQHHHGHIAACMVENGVAEPVIGVAFDGTGFGTDGNIWGGEFLIADLKGFKRVGHLENVPIPGGAAAIKRPYRMALGYLASLGCSGFEDIPSMQSLNPMETDMIRIQIERGINAPLTSSAGRLCDAVSALVTGRHQISYEAQAAIELELIASRDSDHLEKYPFSIDMPSDIRVVRLGELFSAVIDDIRQRVSASRISTRFHRTLAEMVVQMCISIAHETGIDLVALSGGVFQNRLLLRWAVAGLLAEGFEVFTHSLVPSNDGGLSLGQAAIAHFAFPDY